MNPDNIIDAQGELRRLGCLIPAPGFVSAFPVFEDVVPQLKDADIEDIAKSGRMDGRTKFDSSWIQDQGNKGSCNGMAGAMALSRARVRRGLERVMLSGSYLYSLINGGRDNGSLLEDGMREIQTHGIATLDTVPVDAIYPSRYDAAKANAEAARFKGFELYAVRTMNGLWSAAALGFDCVVAVHAGNRFMHTGPSGEAGVDNGPGNHAVGADGLVNVNGRNYLTGYNSWNTSYGVQGRMLLSEDHFRQPFANHQFYALRSTSDDPNGTNPPAVV